MNITEGYILTKEGNKGSEQNQLTLSKIPFLAEIEGGPFGVKLFLLSKVTFLVMEHFFN